VNLPYSFFDRVIVATTKSIVKFIEILVSETDGFPCAMRQQQAQVPSR
jgi:hypothetical protein